MARKIKGGEAGKYPEDTAPVFHRLQELEIFVLWQQSWETELSTCVGIIKRRARQRGQGKVEVSDLAEDGVTLLPDAIPSPTPWAWGGQSAGKDDFVTAWHGTSDLLSKGRDIQNPRESHVPCHSPLKQGELSRSSAGRNPAAFRRIHSRNGCVPEPRREAGSR